MLLAVSNVAIFKHEVDFSSDEDSSFHIRVSPHSSGAMQFLSSMPFDAISSASVWVMLDLLVNVGVSSADKSSIPKSSIQSIGSIDVSPSEGIFLLTALSNMAISRTSADQDFIEVVAKQILEVRRTFNLKIDYSEMQKLDCAVFYIFSYSYIKG